jgi:thermostable 8-oxoguanine DNA glycosylase
LLKECKTRQRQNKLQQLRWKGQRKEDSHIWRNVVEKDLSIMGKKTGGQWPETGSLQRRKIVLGAKAYIKQ